MTRKPVPNPDALPKTERGRARREQILRAAEKVIGQKGYTEASIADITKEAGTALGTFYIYFSSKEDIFSQLVMEMGRMARGVLSNVIVDSAGRLDAERQGILAFLNFVADHPELYRIVEEARFVDPPAYEAYFRGFADAYQQNLEMAQDKNEIRKGNSEVRAWALMGMGKTLGERYVLWGNDTPLEEVADAAFDLIEHGLKAE